MFDVSAISIYCALHMCARLLLFKIACSLLVLLFCCSSKLSRCKPQYHHLSFIITIAIIIITTAIRIDTAQQTKSRAPLTTNIILLCHSCHPGYFFAFTQIRTPIYIAMKKGNVSTIKVRSMTTVPIDTPIALCMPRSRKMYSVYMKFIAQSVLIFQFNCVYVCCHQRCAYPYFCLIDSIDSMSIYVVVSMSVP